MHKYFLLLFTYCSFYSVLGQFSYNRHINYVPVLEEQFNSDIRLINNINSPESQLIQYTYNTIAVLDSNYSTKSFETMLQGFDSIAKNTNNPQVKLRAQLAITQAKTLYSPRSYYDLGIKQQLLLLHQETYFPLIVQHYYTFENLYTYEYDKKEIVQTANSKSKATIIFTNGNAQVLDANKRALKASEKTAVIVLNQSLPFPYTTIYSLQKFTKRAYNQFVEIVEYNNPQLRLLKYLHARNMFNIYSSDYNKEYESYKSWSIQIMNLNSKDNHLVLQKFMEISTKILQSQKAIQANETLFSCDTSSLSPEAKKHVLTIREIAFNVNTLDNSGQLYSALLENFITYINTLPANLAPNPNAEGIEYGRLITSQKKIILTGGSYFPKTKKKKNCQTFELWTLSGLEQKCEEFEKLEL